MFQKAGYVSLPLVVVSDAARHLGIGRKAIYRLIEWGELRAVKVNGAVLIEKRSLDEFKSSGKLV